MKTIKKLAIALACVAATGCATNQSAWKLNGQKIDIPENYASPIQEAIECLSMNKPPIDVRFAVAQIPDSTNVFDYEDQGGYVPNGAHRMLISTLKDTGVRIVNRDDVGILEWELDKSMNKVLGDEKKHHLNGVIRTADPRHKHAYYRLVREGQILGSTHIISGAITSLDFNRASSGAEIIVNGKSIGRRYYNLLVGADISVTNTVTGEIVKADTYTKQLRGVETRAGLYRIISDRLIDINFGVETHEPVQAGIRYTMDYVVYDIVKDVYNLGSMCDGYLPS